jgi:hypothetical protein
MVCSTAGILHVLGMQHWCAFPYSACSIAEVFILSYDHVIMLSWHDEDTWSVDYTAIMATG